MNDSVVQRLDNMLPEWVYQECPGISTVHRDAALARQAQLTKPAGALGRLEQLAVARRPATNGEARAKRVPIVIFAGDHGVVARGVSAYPQEVTIAMMSNFASGGAAISVLARELGSSLEVVDAGTLAQSPVPGIVTDRPRCCSRDFSEEAALEPTELAFASECGKRAVLHVGAGEPDLLILGEMGIGNITASAAIAAALLGVSGNRMAGSGTGLDAAGCTRDRCGACPSRSDKTGRFCRAHPVCGRRSRNCGDLRRDHRRRTASPSDPDRRFHRCPSRH
jgi:nicotinate-nucleotide--dimethylbenzimidazole phosphoribosyltransferase